jgi:putative transposase
MSGIVFYLCHDWRMKRKRKSSAVELKLTEAERAQLEGWSRSRTISAGLARRAQIALLASAGYQNKDIADQVGLNRNDVGKWRRRFSEDGLTGLYDQLKAGRPRSVSDEKIAELLNKTLHRKPKGSTHWSTRKLSKTTGISKSTVQRVWSAFGVQPHRSKGFTLSNDPFFVEKVRDIVGLYLNPPCNAMVLSVDEKSQCQALERDQPVLPMGLGYLEGVTHEYIRHGTLTLFAALDIATGEVISQCSARHRHQEFLCFLGRIDKEVPPDLDIHIVMDNYCTHKQKKVKAWLAKHQRFHIHFTPTYSSWLNQVERWFGLITQHAIRRGSFTSTRQLGQKIDTYVELSRCAAVR